MNINAKDQHLVIVDIKDKLQQINATLDVKDNATLDVKDQFQHVNQKLDNLTLLLSNSRESYSHGGKTISSSHFLNVPELQVASGSERMVAVPIHHEQPQSEGAGETSGEHLEGNRQGPSTYITGRNDNFKVC
ncbi:hypothetical protein OS493_004459 [Desmophyllum pertusum]|uniref:Uncharacterized protein n=1 Tax=Desmophyllum pertusum TaxID=174260 RepID=A0A9X0CZ68_9CNID|nr:hypothetical protein OS493_004459 [Desmophyllum pertusum]